MKFNDKEPINNDGAECPHCGYVHDMTDSDHDDGAEEIIECHECEKEFISTVCIMMDWRTQPVPCADGHDFPKFSYDTKWYASTKIDWEKEYPPEGEMWRIRECKNCTQSDIEKKIMPFCTGPEHIWSDWSDWSEWLDSKTSEGEFRIRSCIRCKSQNEIERREEKCTS